MDFGRQGDLNLEVALHMLSLICIVSIGIQVQMLSRQVDIKIQKSMGRLKLDINRRRAQDHGKDLTETKAV